MMRRRSSSRCSRKLIAGIASCDSPSGEIVEANSGIGGLRCHWRRGFRIRGFGERSAGYRAHRRVAWWKNLLFRLDFAVDVRDLGLDLGTKFVAGALELVERLANLASNLRQL